MKKELKEYRIWVRLTDKQLEKLDKLAKLHRWGRAETIRYCIDVKRVEK